MADSTSGIHPLGPRGGELLSHGATLDGFAAEAAAHAGVALRTLEPLATLFVETRNTRYQIIVTRGDEILIQGGTFFPEPTAACLDGASLGGSLLKVGCIVIGLRMEIRTAERRILTTAVQSIARRPSDPASRPH
jgi:hypothetical protein